jgi:hypothetical protein
VKRKHSCPCSRNGSPTERSDALWKFRSRPSLGCTTETIHLSLAHGAMAKNLQYMLHIVYCSLCFINKYKSQLLQLNRIALWDRYIRNATSLKSPDMPWRTTILMCDFTHSMTELHKELGIVVSSRSTSNRRLQYQYTTQLVRSDEKIAPMTE